MLRFWWTVIKLTLNTAGLVLATTALVPTRREASASVQAGVPYMSGGGLVRESAAATSVLVVTVVVSVFKPSEGPARVTRARTGSPQRTHALG